VNITVKKNIKHLNLIKLLLYKIICIWHTQWLKWNT